VRLATYYEAGHILGSGMIAIDAAGERRTRRIIFTETSVAGTDLSFETFDL
jgi:predicted metal-dependent RNase